MTFSNLIYWIDIINGKTNEVAIYNVNNHFVTHKLKEKNIEYKLEQRA
jgi:hypothetical protein